MNKSRSAKSEIFTDGSSGKCVSIVFTFKATSVLPSIVSIIAENGLSVICADILLAVFTTADTVSPARLLSSSFK